MSDMILRRDVKVEGVPTSGMVVGFNDTTKEFKWTEVQGVYTTTSLKPLVHDGTNFVVAMADLEVNVADVIGLSGGELINSGQIQYPGHGLIVGKWYYLNQSGGGYVDVKPTSGIVQQLFFVVDKDNIIIDIEEAYEFGSTDTPAQSPWRNNDGSEADETSTDINFDLGSVSLGNYGQGNHPQVGAATRIGVDKSTGKIVELEDAPTTGGTGSAVENFIGSLFTAANNTTDIFHIKLPYKKNVDSKMYHVKATGYAYGGGVNGRNIDITWVGYCYAPASNIYNQQTDILPATSTITAGQYFGSDGHLYLWFKTPNVYYNTFRLDAISVGNGTELKASDVQIIQDPAITL